MKDYNHYAESEVDVLEANESQENTCNIDNTSESDLDFWLTQNIKIMETLTVKEPVAWSEQDVGG